VRHILLPDFLVAKINPCKKGYLFTTEQGNPLDKDLVGLIIRQKTKAAGIFKRITPHSFRRSLATNLYKREGRLETIQKQLGHSNIQTTLGYIHNDYNTLYQDYSKLFQNHQSPATSKLSLKDYTNDELLAELGQRMLTSRLELANQNQGLAGVIRQDHSARRSYE
jgi:hypothetical protein